MLMLHAAVSLSQADRAASFRRDRSDSIDGGRQHVFDEVRASDSGRCSCLPFFDTEHGLAKHCTALERDRTTERQMSWLTDRRLP